MPFRKWIADQGFPYFPSDFYDSPWLVQAHQCVLDEAHRLSSKAWNHKQQKYKQRLRSSFSERGGRDAFQRIKKESLPEVNVLFRKVKLDLMQQNWEGEGREHIWIRNSNEFCPDDRFALHSGLTSVVAILQDGIVLDKRISHEEAKTLTKLVPISDPNGIADEFFGGWNQYWQRDIPDEEPPDQFAQWFESLPTWNRMNYQEISFEEWQEALYCSKKHSMRGADGWSVVELGKLPRPIFTLLRHIFDHAESCGAWPTLLTKTWVVLLPKVEGSLSWKEVRPISIASMLYRLYARIRTRQILNRLPPKVLPFVGLGTPTCVHWATLLDKIQVAYDSQGVLSGVVCDILKAFNCLNRQVIHKLGMQGGIPTPILTAWAGSLKSLRRQVQIGGYLYGEQHSSTTGYPEGDPLSVTALFILVWNFGWTLSEQFQDVEFRAYADNLELVSHHSPRLASAFHTLVLLTKLSRVELVPEKSWSWANTSHARMYLAGVLQIDGRFIQKSLSERNLGASMRYSLKRNAKVRNIRWTEGYRRLACIENLPLSRDFKSRLITSGVFPQCLPGAEAELINERTWFPLRAKVAKALGYRYTRNPYLACAVTTKRIVDPLFTAILNGLRLCRLIAKHAPHHIDNMLHCFGVERPRYKGTVTILAERLRNLQWSYEGEGIWDFRGARIHIFMSSPRHIQFLLERSWLTYICDKIRHRKYLGNVSSICRMNLRHHSELSQSQKALVDFQSCGEQFTNDAKKYFGDVSPTCPFCQNCDDSRLHRFEECSFFQPVRREFPLLFNNWSSLPMQAKAYSLWPEPPMYDQFLCLLHNIPFPQVDRLEDDNLHIAFTDGSCKWQKYPDIRISSFAAIEVLGNGSSAVIHSGLVPGQQSIYRGEILAGTVAVLRFHRVRIFTDNAAFLKTAKKILHCHLLQLPILLPEEERDLWSLFALALTAKSRVEIVKTKAHTEWAKSSDAQVRFEGFYNDLADSAAKTVIATFAGCFPKYDEMCRAYLKQLSFAKHMAKFHARIGEFASLKPSTNNVESEVSVVGNVTGHPFFAAPTCDDDELPHELSRSFLIVLRNWIVDLEWHENTEDSLYDTSWQELFGCFLISTHTFPPVLTKHGEVTLDDNEDAIVYTHTFTQGLKTWRRYVRAIEKVIPDLLPRKINSAASMTRWKRKGPGVVGRHSSLARFTHEKIVMALLGGHVI